MATNKDTITFILAHLGHAERFSAKAMFGEYALYVDGKPVGFICDDQLLVKILPESASLEGRCERAKAYPGSKDYYLVPEDLITGDRKLPGMLLQLGEALPQPKAKKSGKKR